MARTAQKKVNKKRTTSRVPTKQEIQKELTRLKKDYANVVKMYNEAAIEITELNTAYTEKVEKILSKPFWTRRGLKKVLLGNENND